MRYNFKIRQLNSSFSDPVFFIRNVYKKKAILFDCGRLGNIDNSELQDISDIFVSHTHLDHFSGFDRFLRANINSKNSVRFFGPAGFIKNVEGKLNSYTWNLIEDYDLKIIVIELTKSGNKKAVFAAKSSFVREEIEFIEQDLNLDDGFKLEYDIFDHGTPSVGYRLIEPRIININKDALIKARLKEGVWLKELKRKILDGSKGVIPADSLDGSVELDIDYLKDNITEEKERQDITYITDIAPTEENSEKAIKLATNSALLIIEAVFTLADYAHAKAKNHLTITISKDIFNRSNSHAVRFIHFASRYERQKTEFYEELYSDIKSKLFLIER